MKIIQPFGQNWTLRREGVDDIAVVIPHDAMISETRSADAAGGYHSSYFPGGRYLYEKRWVAEVEPGHTLSVHFEGVYGATEVSLNGQLVGESVSPYREFSVPLTSALRPGEENLLEVRVDNTLTPNSRWYTGSGVYRPVSLISAPETRFAFDGVRIRTLSTQDRARLCVEVDVDGPLSDAASVRISLRDGDSVLLEHVGVIGSNIVEAPGARLWSAEDPFLYTAEIELVEDGRILDRFTQRVGIRTVEVDATHGLRINGQTVLLRGACVHHDNGPLGAATFRAAEFRRIRILKENGFNAIRSSHNPLSRDMTDACDELGMYVMDELSDVWFAPKTAHDLSARFEDLWPDDARSLVAKVRNHPSVIMYSIGNEIAESGTTAGIDAARRISSFVRELDTDRPTTLAVNFLLNVMASQGKSVFSTEKKAPVRKSSAATSTMANVISNRIGRITQFISGLPIADKSTRDVFPAVDVAGYNYAWSRYKKDARNYPSRVVVGSESMSGDIVSIWPLVKELPNVIGDFMWTGWDYLGEAGIGTWAYGSESGSITKPFPQLTAGCGAIDITGVPGAPMLLARAVWGELDAPAIAVRPMDRSGQKVRRMAWRPSDAVASWAWRGSEGKRAEIEVYSSDDEVELLINGRSLGRRRAGVRAGFVTRFRVPYEAGEITAVGYCGNIETSRSTLKSASDTSLALVAESSWVESDGSDVAFVNVEIRDHNGVIEMLDDDNVAIEIVGPAELVGFASAAPSSTESFTDDEHTTWRGRALAVIRGTGAPGTIVLTATSTRHGTVSLQLQATATATSLASVR
ncbi:glycoside hydrolase family 2 TIM barrel-domain containing protein [Microterricola viridarii]|uniref:Glycosyl hydrolases family 2 n=1 Tax=Microterricola viridarii TaxID=412690 RepID=A0A1H1VER0_9MICO|nr:glycoside hydrolase family 2 TIM barrel-domain containing protein [Microterricola viridarii]SDS82896.1 Glycosyl hydrolases family 2 [Microterricola viridarii]